MAWTFSAFLFLPGINQAQANSDHIISASFGDWNVRHVFDYDTLEYRYSDAKTKITLEDGRTATFQINHPHPTSGLVNTFILGGWLEDVVIVIDKKEYTYGQSYLHTFYGHVDDNFIKALANTKNPVKIKIRASRASKEWDYKGTISSKGSSAALRWVKALK